MGGPIYYALICFGEMRICFTQTTDCQIESLFVKPHAFLCVFYFRALSFLSLFLLFILFLFYQLSLSDLLSWLLQSVGVRVPYNVCFIFCRSDIISGTTAPLAPLGSIIMSEAHHALHHLHTRKI